MSPGHGPTRVTHTLDWPRSPPCALSPTARPRTPSASGQPDAPHTAALRGHPDATP